MAGETDKIAGTVKEKVGAVTGDEQLQAEGKAQELQGKAEDFAEQAKDAIEDAVDQAKELANDVADKLKGAFEKK